LSWKEFWNGPCDIRKHRQTITFKPCSVSVQASSMPKVSSKCSLSLHRELLARSRERLNLPRQQLFRHGPKANCSLWFNHSIKHLEWRHACARPEPYTESQNSEKDTLNAYLTGSWYALPVSYKCSNSTFLSAVCRSPFSSASSRAFFAIS